MHESTRRLLAVALCLVVWLSSPPVATASSPPAAVIGPGLVTAGLDSSEQLLAELNCVSCHEPRAALRERLFGRQAPLLDDVGARVTPGFLRRYLSSPAGVKPGVAMPDLLHAMNDGDRGAAVEDLVHFLMSRKTDPRAVESDSYLIKTGERLFHTVGCVACHEPRVREPEERSEPLDPALERFRRERLASIDDFESIPLGDLARKTTVSALAAFLRDPRATRPSGRMPSLRLSESETHAIAMYLLRAQAERESREQRALPGVRYEYYEANFGKVEPSDFAGWTPKSTGTVSTFSISPRKRNDDIAFRFTALLQIEKRGRYTFYTSSDDGSRLYIGGKLVVDNDGVHSTQERRGSIELEAGEHPIMVTWFERGGEEVLRVHYDGPGIEKRIIPESVLTHDGAAMEPLDAGELRLDVERAKRGARLFGTLGCASCHGELEKKRAGVPRARKAMALAKLNPDAKGGCLSRAPAAGVPAFALDDALRTSLRAALASAREASKPLTLAARAKRALAVFNCLGCHERDGIGGPNPHREHLFRPSVEADMGDEGRLPPRLTGVGNKLTSEALHAIILRGEVARPYMATRMPQFGEENVGWLPGALEELDAVAETLPEIVTKRSPKEIGSTGRRLVGTKGLSCITCHDYGTYGSLGIPALDLTRVTKRLRKDWFRRYLLVPSKLRPGTRMPEFWPDGEAVLKDVLDGETELQIEAIWTYLSRGQSVRIPFGLKRVGQEIVAGDNEAVIYRHWISGAGPRGIGVGYPEEINLAWDANDLRLALIWRGHFIDASKHRSGRGAGFQGPMGHAIESFPAGRPIARLNLPDTPWPSGSVRESGLFRMRGYTLDQRRRPRFRYSYRPSSNAAEIQVEDFPQAIAELGEAYFLRELVFRAEDDVDGLWFRAATGGKLAANEDGSIQVSDALRLRFPGLPGKPVIRGDGGSRELLVPIVFQDGVARIRMEMRW